MRQGRSLGCGCLSVSDQIVVGQFFCEPEVVVEHPLLGGSEVAKDHLAVQPESA
jgi:hypothetical protein